jgi:GT2 family glycosyltransferase
MIYDISASLVLYNSDVNDVRNVLNSYFSNHNLKVHLTVIDNSSVKNIQYLEIFSSNRNIRYIFTGKNLGYGRGNNLAIKLREFKCKYHLILNPDVTFDGLILNDISNFMDMNNNIGLLMPKILNSDGSLQYLCKMLPTPYDWILRAFLRNTFLSKKLNYYFEFRFSNYDKIMSVPYLSGCFMFIRNQVFDEVGYFDEKIFLHTEDVDLSRRIYEKFNNVFYPHQIVYHKHNKETYKKFRVLYYHIKSTFYYFNKWGWFFDKKRTFINKSAFKLYN